MTAAERERQSARTPGQIWIPLAAFSALTGFLALRHEMWRDEVRAFSIATKSPSWASMFSSLHQEGHPGLWYVLLRASYAVTHSNLVLPLLALVIAIGAAYMVLRYAPFPFWLRLLTVFGAFLSYEYSVIARNYGIGVLLLFIACTLFSDRKEKGIILGVVLAMMANTSVHAAMASAMISFLWVLDAFDRERRDDLLKIAPLAGLAIAVAGTIVAIWSARPTPDMSYATSLQHFGLPEIFRSIAIDPGAGLKGVVVRGSDGTGWLPDIAASGEIPWLRLGVYTSLPSRIIVDVVLVIVAFGIAQSRKHLAALVASVLAFEVLFSAVYPGALRHQGILTFLIVGICWIAINDRKVAADSFAHRVALGLMPMMLIQTIALPIVLRRHLTHPASASKAFGNFVRNTPRLRDAILMSEPDYLEEALPYYVKNRVYFPRQREYGYRVYFDAGKHRQHDLSLGGLLAIADSMGCVTRSPVLLSIGYPQFFSNPDGIVHGVFHGADFTWTAAEKDTLSTRARLLGDFEGATSDENYQVYELAPPDATACSARLRVSHEGVP